MGIMPGGCTIQYIRDTVNKVWYPKLDQAKQIMSHDASASMTNHELRGSGCHQNVLKNQRTRQNSTRKRDRDDDDDDLRNSVAES